MPVFKIDDTNFANDLKLRQRALSFINQIGKEIRDDREVLNEKYMQYYNIFRLVFDTRFYNGEAQVYIPQVRKNIEQYVTRLKRALFPTDDVFEIEPVDKDSDTEEAEVVKDHLKWQIQKKIKLKAKITMFLRQLVMYGWSVAEIGWEREVKTVIGMVKQEEKQFEMETDELTGESITVETGEVINVLVEEEKELVLKNNPTFDAIDCFSCYIWPTTSNDIQEAYGVLKLSKQTFDHLKNREINGEYINIEEAKRHKTNSVEEWEWALQERLGTDGLTNNEILQMSNSK